MKTPWRLHPLFFFFFSNFQRRMHFGLDLQRLLSFLPRPFPLLPNQGAVAFKNKQTKRGGGQWTATAVSSPFDGLPRRGAGGKRREEEGGQGAAITHSFLCVHVSGRAGLCGLPDFIIWKGKPLLMNGPLGGKHLSPYSQFKRRTFTEPG